MSDDRQFKVIMHDSVSLDGSFVGFDYSPEMMGLHYSIAAGFGDTIRLSGSSTCTTAIELFGGFTDETQSDFLPPERSDTLAYWAITDSQAALQGKLHYFRRSEYCRDIIILVSEQTPRGYLDYLRERNYRYFCAGTDKVDLKEALRLLAERYDTRIILVDAGRDLTNALINQNLIDEISLLILPVILGKSSNNLFGNVLTPCNLDLVESQQYPGGHQWLLYSVRKEK
jgi:2,5-diamino-6-(ribosylamino)-4(3H)-pyrimidinone 5'-phosphate reductase